jgi:hypothetical protein
MQRQGGFDAVVGNPPWNRVKLQEVEWFAERDRTIAAQPRASDRKRMIDELKQRQAPLWHDYQAAVVRAQANARVLSHGKLGSDDYPQLGHGDLNLYSLFVERAQNLIREDGIVALLVPSGIAADKSAAPFFKKITSSQRLGALFDFENRRVFFPGVDARFKFSALVFGGSLRHFKAVRCAFYLRSVNELSDPARILDLSSQDFDHLNPNTGAAPVFRTQRDAQITLRLHREHPVLIERGGVKFLGAKPDKKAWPIKYARMLDMTNDSKLFLKAQELEQQGFKSGSLGRWVNEMGEQALPLYEGKMVQMFDHRAADVILRLDNLKRPAQQKAIGSSEKTNPQRYPCPQFWIKESDVRKVWRRQWCIVYKSITAPSNMRTLIGAIVPYCGIGNSLTMLVPESHHQDSYARFGSLLMANLSSMAFDYGLRQKVQGQNLNAFIIEQSAVISPQRFEVPLASDFAVAMRTAGLIDEDNLQPTVADFVIRQVLALSYTAYDLAPFAVDLGYVNEANEVKAPFVWNDNERRTRMAALDALFFFLYGFDAQEVDYVLDTFPIVREQDVRAFGYYRTKQDILALLPLLV